MSLRPQHKVFIATKSRDISQVISENYVSLYRMAYSERDEVHAYQTILKTCSFISCFVIDVYIPLACQMGSDYLVYCHKLVPTSDKLLLIKWVKLNSKNWAITCVSIG
jgi:hypothetical protein